MNPSSFAAMLALTASTMLSCGRSVIEPRGAAEATAKQEALAQSCRSRLDGEVCGAGRVCSNGDCVDVTPPDSWRSRAPIPGDLDFFTGRWAPGAARIGRQLYVVGGYGKMVNPLRSLLVYDPASDTWARRTSMHDCRFHGAVVALNGLVYAIGGCGCSDGCAQEGTPATVEAYDPATDTWTYRASLNIPRTFQAAAVVNGKIYVVGGYGYGACANRNGLCPVEFGSAAVEEYDPATDVWTLKSSMPTARRGLAAAAVHGRLYAIGGVLAGNYPLVTAISTVEEYDPTTDTWAAAPSLKHPRFDLSAVAVDGNIYAFGGEDGTTFVAANEEYDPLSHTWTDRAPMPLARRSMGAAAVNGKIYAVGGPSPQDDVMSSNALSEYTPPGANR